MLLKNRAKVLYCTRLGQAQGTEAKQAIEAEMAADETGEGLHILEALSQVRTFLLRGLLAQVSWRVLRMADQGDGPTALMRCSARC